MPTGPRYLFSSVAFTDFALLSLVVILTFFTHHAEGQGLRKANLSYQKVTRVVGEFIDALRATKREEDVSASPEQWADVIDAAMNRVNDTITEAANTIKSAASVIGGFEQRTNGFFNRIEAGIGTVVKDTGDTLSTTVRDLRGELGKYTDQTNKLLESVDKVKDASETLQQNVGQYTNLADSIDKHIASLQTSQAPSSAR